ncbi:DoxX family protein [Phytohabitans aurantiacus]|jgi:putative oxidoreductase|uniref:Integral membrane protein n=1 Tax=Phytohabitans aurantiacus TaxID=3016789 RepID=A0ABQ5QZM1_9ACTN|nr:DoxX family protein [Phytohabitans aurantiacus]GLI00009.1 integral membrane protein [Phytohabitans aurantiacus]
MNPARLNDLVTTLFRFVLGLLFAIHGASSLFGVFGGNRGSGEAIAVGTWPGWWAALIQFAGGVLVMAGLGTRIAAIVCSGSMAYAYFVVHQPDALLPLNNGGELSALFCWSFLMIAVLGPGKWSVDSILAQRREEATAAATV